MDPDVNLEEQRKIADRIVNGPDGASEDWSRLAELVIALDEWIGNGGFLPKAWQHRATHTPVHGDGRCDVCGDWLDDRGQCPNTHHHE